MDTIKLLDWEEDNYTPLHIYTYTHELIHIERKRGSNFFVSVCLSVCLCVCVSVCLSIRASVFRCLIDFVFSTRVIISMANIAINAKIKYLIEIAKQI